ncbi:ras-related protein Rab-44 [Myotis lucifugus]|uniref:ras-related protein Rab-44 n=1 Tax=Myotis lucifugus TaxID=59463 RepID=UPI000CCC7182|nr:ras-related protein Rab-44 [Myotis lucifugus]
MIPRHSLSPGQSSMEAGHRAARKGRKLGSSRRRQIREPAAGQDGPVAPESWPSQAAEELQGFFQACGAAERGFVTREDLAVAKFSFLGSEEEPEMIFDWVDVERKGHLSLEEFSSGLKSIFGSSPSTQRVRGRRPLSSKRGSAATSFPVLEEADAEEREAFLAFMEQLGGDHSLPEQEIWQLWGKLRQEEPQLAGNLEGFLAQMTSRLQEARADKEALELTLRKRDSDHQREVQQLYEEMEQQIGRQKQQLQAKSDSRDLALSSQMQEVLEAKEREAQQLAEGQREVSAAARSPVPEDSDAGPPVPRAGEDEAPDPQAVSSEEAPLPGLFEDNDDWDRLLNSFNSPWHRTPQLLWSPPATPTSPSAPQIPRVVRQISISEQHDLLFGRDPSSDANGAPRSPPGVTARPEEGRAVGPGGQDLSVERPAEGLGAHPQEGPGPEGLEGVGQAPLAEPSEGLEAEAPLAEPTVGLEGVGQAPLAEPSVGLEGVGQAPLAEPSEGLEGVTEAPLAEPSEGLEGVGQAPLAEPSVGLEGVGQAPLAEPPEGLEGVTEAPLAEPPEGLEGVTEAPLAEPPEGLEGVTEASLAEPPEGLEAEAPLAEPSVGLEGVGQASLAEPSEGLEGVTEAPLAESSQGLEAVGQAPLTEPSEGLEGVGQAPLAEPSEGLEAEAPLAEPSEGLEAEAPLAEPSQGLEAVAQAPTKAVAQQGELGPDVLEGRPGGLREAPGQVQLSGLPALPQQSLEEEPREEEGKQGGQGRLGLSSEQPSEARGLRTGPSERPQRSSLPAPLPPDTAQAQAEAEGPAGRPSPPRDSPPRGAQPGGGAGPQPPTNTLPSTEAALEAQPRPPPTAAQAEGEQGPPQPREPRAENRPEDPGTGSGEAGLTPSPGGPTGSEPPANPDYIYHIIFLGDSNVGKTSFLHLLHQDTFASGLTATVGVDFRVKNLLVDNKYYALQLWDTAGQERYHSMTRQLLRKADGVVLMYDVTSQESFAHVRYWLDCLQDAGCVGVQVLLLGNKMDCDEERQVSTEAGQQLAQELGLSFGECSAALGHNILEPMVNLARSLKRQEDLLKGSLVEVAPERPPKKAGCCS